STSGLAAPTWNLVISNVPGPQIPLYCAGAKVVANYPVSVITDAMGLNITLMSYLGCIDVGIIADRDQMPDVQNLIDWLADRVDLHRLTSRERRYRRSHLLASQLRTRRATGPALARDGAARACAPGNQGSGARAVPRSAASDPSRAGGRPRARRRSRVPLRGP